VIYDLRSNLPGCRACLCSLPGTWWTSESGKWIPTFLCHHTFLAYKC
jgi:hypothetical protein